MTEEDRIGLINEIDILKQVDHPNIVKLIDVYEDTNTFSLVLELMTGGEVSEISDVLDMIIFLSRTALPANSRESQLFGERSKRINKTYRRRY